MIEQILMYDYQRNNDRTNFDYRHNNDRQNFDVWLSAQYCQYISRRQLFLSRILDLWLVAGSRCNYHLVRFPNPYLVVYNTVGEPD